MGWIIATRNPTNRKLVIIHDGNEPDEIAEFETEGDAHMAAAEIPMCRAWDWTIVEVN